MAIEFCMHDVPIDIDLAVKRTKSDMRDDWFSDPLQYKDSLDPNIVEDYFKTRCNDAKNYNSSTSEQFNLPKKGFMLRYTLETNVYDRVCYQGLVDVIAKECDSMLHERVYSHRVDGGNKPFMFKHNVDAWRAYTSHVKEEFESGNKYLLVTDIQNYFESIDINRLTVQLKGLITDMTVSSEHKVIYSRCFDLIKKLLVMWSPHDNLGIPQNRDASSLLASLYLNDVDRAMLSKGYNYFRYMDDIRVVCDDEFQARRALKDLIVSLRFLGLNVNSKKTKILTQESPEIGEFVSAPDRDMEQIDTLWKSKNQHQLKLAIPLLIDYSNRLIDSMQMDSRAFRFCVNRLEQLARCAPLNQHIDFKKITDAAVSQLVNQPWSTDSIVRYLRSVELSENNVVEIMNILASPDRNIYEWQAYLLWQLISFSKYKDQSLVSLSRETLARSREHPEVAGAATYLGVNGSQSDKVHIAQKFSQLPKSYLVQRNCINAIHELDYGSYIAPYVKDHLLDEVKGMYMRISKNYRGQYFFPLDPVPPSQLYRNLPDHVS